MTPMSSGGSRSKRIRSQTTMANYIKNNSKGKKYIEQDDEDEDEDLNRALQESKAQYERENGLQSLPSSTRSSANSQSHIEIEIDSDEELPPMKDIKFTTTPTTDMSPNTKRDSTEKSGSRNKSVYNTKSTRSSRSSRRSLNVKKLDVIYAKEDDHQITMSKRYQEFRQQILDMYSTEISKDGKIFINPSKIPLISPNCTSEKKFRKRLTISPIESPPSAETTTNTTTTTIRKPQLLEMLNDPKSSKNHDETEKSADTDFFAIKPRFSSSSKSLKRKIIRQRKEDQSESDFEIQETPSKQNPRKRPYSNEATHEKSAKKIMENSAKATSTSQISSPNIIHSTGIDSNENKNSSPAAVASVVVDLTDPTEDIEEAESHVKSKPEKLESPKVQQDGKSSVPDVITNSSRLSSPDILVEDSQFIPQFDDDFDHDIPLSDFEVEKDNDPAIVDSSNSKYPNTQKPSALLNRLPQLAETPSNASSSNKGFTSSVGVPDVVPDTKSNTKFRSNPFSIQSRPPEIKKNVSSSKILYKDKYQMQNCPICSKDFPTDQIEEHAAVCGDEDVMQTATKKSTATVISPISDDKDKTVRDLRKTRLKLLNRRMAKKKNRYDDEELDDISDDDPDPDDMPGPNIKIYMPSKDKNESHDTESGKSRIPHHSKDNKLDSYFKFDSTGSSQSEKPSSTNKSTSLINRSRFFPPLSSTIEDIGQYSSHPSQRVNNSNNSHFRESFKPSMEEPLLSASELEELDAYDYVSGNDDHDMDDNNNDGMMNDPNEALYLGTQRELSPLADFVDLNELQANGQLNTQHQGFFQQLDIAQMENNDPSIPTKNSNSKSNKFYGKQWKKRYSGGGSHHRNSQSNSYRGRRGHKIKKMPLSEPSTVGTNNRRSGGTTAGSNKSKTTSTSSTSYNYYKTDPDFGNMASSGMGWEGVRSKNF